MTQRARFNEDAYEAATYDLDPDHPVFETPGVLLGDEDCPRCGTHLFLGCACTTAQVAAALRGDPLPR